MAELSNPHDRYFRETLANPQAARDFLRYYLPAEVAALLDPAETPELMKDSFVDPELRIYFSDLLYKVQLLGGQGNRELELTKMQSRISSR